MIMKSYAVVGLLVVSVAACGPDMSKIDLSGCMKQQTTQLRVCMDSANTKLDACNNLDAQCQKDAAKLTESCLTVALDGISWCIADTEHKLKN